MSQRNADNPKAWLEEGIRILAKNGNPRSLYIDTLTTNLGSTSELFHSLFSDWIGYTEELMRYWKEINLETISTIDEGRGSPYTKLHKILNLILNLSEMVLIAFRA